MEVSSSPLPPLASSAPAPTDDASTPSTPVESPDVWFEDGDIVLSVTEGGVEHHFRVHRVILTMASPVFRDMFSMQQPSDRKNLPVSLPGDSVHDLTALLKELYVTRFVEY